jgi:lysozyme family protein
LVCRKPSATGSLDRSLAEGRNLDGVSAQGQALGQNIAALIHAMGCGFNFACHLHNGEPLANRTKHVPAGQPQMGTLFSWENSAIDALTQEGFKAVDGPVHSAHAIPLGKGFGYRKMGKLTLYLWSFSNL